MLKILVFCFAGFLGLAGCGMDRNALSPKKPENPPEGAARITVAVAKSAAPVLARSFSTTWNQMMVEITASDMDTLRDSLEMADTAMVTSLTFPAIKAGNGRKIRVWTVNGSNGRVIHTAPSQTVDIPEGRTAYANFLLKPVQGSIYFTFSAIDTRIDSIYVFFATAAETLKAHGSVASGGRILLTLDYVPDGTLGHIGAFGVDYHTVPPETLFAWQKEYRFRSDCDSTLSAIFTAKPGIAGVEVALTLPGVTLVEGSMNSAQLPDTCQAGPLFISEILYSAEDSEYVEIHNPTSSEIYLDTLILEVNEVFRAFPAVRIPAGGFFVISRKAAPYANGWHPVQSALDLASTFERLALRRNDGVLMDCVSFTGVANSQEWPAAGASSKTAIVLDSLGGPGYNDFGKHWTLATSPIPGTGLKGTPRASGR